MTPLDYKEQLATMLSETVDQSTWLHKDSTYAIVSKVAYLIGVPKSIFENEHEPPKIDVYDELDKDRGARIIRNLCRLRTAIERGFGKINAKMISEHKGLMSMPEYIPVECITQLSYDGIFLKESQRLNQIIIDINKLISDRINNCKNIFPIWINWDYIRGLFIMPNGLSDAGIKEAANEYYSLMSYYPYKMYINWPPFDSGNILYNDKKFITLLYHWNHDDFADYSKVTDASALTKNNIYDFIEASEKTVFVVDCENSDPYKLCATFNNLDAHYMDKISKVILYDDIHTASAWQILDTHVSVPIEHIHIERLKQSKSLVDIMLTAGACKEFYQNNVDSFVVVSSDSDYWGLISSLPDANFLVMVEFEKTGPDIKNALFNSGIFFCYIDDFYTGNSGEIEINALLREVRRYLEQSVRLNVNEMMDAAYRATRIIMTDAEQKQFFKKYIKPMVVDIDEDGNLTIQLRGKL